MDLDVVLFGRWEFVSPEQEAKAILHKKPFGITADFFRLANSSGNFTRGVSSLTDFVSVIREALEPADARLNSLGILCHSSGDSLMISGSLNADPILFLRLTLITPRQVRTLLGPALSGLRGKILPEAQITLYGCHTASSYEVPVDLLDAFATAFQVSCYGFKRGLQVCVNINRGVITDRGYIRVDDGSDQSQKHTCQAAGCTQDLRELKPDAVRAFVRI